jgi:hypothetical protein
LAWRSNCSMCCWRLMSDMWSIERHIGLHFSLLFFS